MVNPQHKRTEVNDRNQIDNSNLRGAGLLTLNNIFLNHHFFFLVNLHLKMT